MNTRKTSRKRRIDVFKPKPRVPRPEDDSDFLQCKCSDYEICEMCRRYYA